MDFTAIGLAPLPDILTARRNHGLQDLSDADVAKVLFHRRKQDGRGDVLGWDQLRIGAVSLVQFGNGDVRLDSLTLDDTSELEMIDALFQSMREAPPLVTWGGTTGFLPLFQFRCLKHRRSAADYWVRLEDRRNPHLDLQGELTGNCCDCDTPSLDEMAKRLFLPGMLGRTEDRLWDQWLAGEHRAVGTFADYQALNTALLALEVFLLKGRASLDEIKIQHDRLFERISDPALGDRHAEFLQHWEQGS